MVQQLKNNYLHLETKHTNKMVPGYLQYIDINKYPLQHPDVGKTITLKYRNNNIVDKDNYEGEEKIDPHDIYEGEFIILRYDVDAPHRFVAISIDYKILLVDTVKGGSIIHNFLVSSDKVYRYAIQMTNYIGIEVEDQYHVGNTNSITGYILRCDETEPCYSITVEYIGNKIRFVTGDEVLSKIPEGTKLDIYKTEEDIVTIRKALIEGKEIWS